MLSAIVVISAVRVISLFNIHEVANPLSKVKFFTGQVTGFLTCPDKCILHREILNSPAKHFFIFLKTA